MAGASYRRICALSCLLVGTGLACAEGETLDFTSGGHAPTGAGGGEAGTSVGSSGADGSGSGGSAPGATTGSGGSASTAGPAGSAGSAGSGGSAGSSGGGGTGGTAGSGSGGATGGRGGAGGTGGTSAGGGGMDASVGVGGSAGALMDASAEPAPTCTTSCRLKVQYQCRQNGLGALKELSFTLKVVNTGTEAVPLSSITMRYYYTIDSAATQAANCDYALLGCGLVSFSFKTVAPAKPTADRYLEIALTGAGAIEPGTDSGDIQIRIHDQANQATYMQSNDYSFLSTGAVFYDRMETPGYAGGTKVWGTEP